MNYLTVFLRDPVKPKNVSHTPYFLSPQTSLYLTTVKCNMVYFNYPMDRQTCTVKIQSCEYTRRGERE